MEKRQDWCELKVHPGPDPGRRVIKTLPCFMISFSVMPPNIPLLQPQPKLWLNFWVVPTLESHYELHIQVTVFIYFPVSPREKLQESMRKQILCSCVFFLALSWAADSLCLEPPGTLWGSRWGIRVWFLSHQPTCTKALHIHVLIYIWWHLKAPSLLPDFLWESPSFCLI